MMMLLCIKQHLSKIEISIYKKLSNTEAELKKSVAYKRKRVRVLSSISRCIYFFYQIFYQILFYLSRI